ncbi:hypothetical protein C8P66_10295 [Humitalea rosea]|uniref:Uncharacterized protein n=1 Tax=Humitalea rosea TaxID=990373 RepID=A0A2W7IVV6_9PROT|nr:hypothetical protein [Humitalea rosea]PZW50407.1 hypothetical protein C8P66_10295 [Humitalea rosea]
MDQTFIEGTVAAIEAWHGISLPNDRALAALSDLQAALAEFAMIRDGLAFEDEPASFEAALAATKEPG